MFSKNWGYDEFVSDIETIFDELFSAKGFSITNRTDRFSCAEFNNQKVGLYFNYDDSKALLLQFRKYTSPFDYEEFHLKECCLAKKLEYINPICQYNDRECIKKGLEYIKEILEKNFEEELLGNFDYKKDHDLLVEEKYFLKKTILYLPLKDELKQRIRKIYTPNAGIEEMRNRLIQNNEYPEEFNDIYDKYLRRN